MYHSISEITDGLRHPYYELRTPANIFEEHMQWLAQNDYRSLPVSGLQGAVLDGQDGKHVAITFDDGFRDFYTTAFPILQKYGLTATVFLPTAYISHNRQQFLGLDCMTWSEVEELHGAGIEFGSHTVSHARLYGLSQDALEMEISESKNAIEEKLGVPVRTFAHPYAFPSDSTYSDRLRDLLAKHGYRAGVCTALGLENASGDPYFRRRLPMNGFDDADFFQAKLEGAYDWLGTVQTVRKRIMQRVKHG
jgi:peptidoglycan/xylan/chitin deacetylase (PgdA/CDA1 family)